VCTDSGEVNLRKMDTFLLTCGSRCKTLFTAEVASVASSSRGAPVHLRFPFARGPVETLVDRLMAMRIASGDRMTAFQTRFLPLTALAVAFFRLDDRFEYLRRVGTIHNSVAISSVKILAAPRA